MEKEKKKKEKEVSNEPAVPHDVATQGQEYTAAHLEELKHQSQVSLKPLNTSLLDNEVVSALGLVEANTLPPGAHYSRLGTPGLPFFFLALDNEEPEPTIPSELEIQKIKDRRKRLQRAGEDFIPLNANTKTTEAVDDDDDDNGESRLVRESAMDDDEVEVNQGQ